MNIGHWLRSGCTYARSAFVSSGTARSSTMPSDERREPVVVARRVAHDRAHGRHVLILHRAARARRSAASRPRPWRTRPTRSSSACRSAAGPSSLVPSTSCAGASIGVSAVRVAPLADEIEVLERRSRSDPSPCGTTRRPGSRGAARAAGAATSPSTCAGILLQVRLDAGRRLRQRRAEQVLEHPLAAHDRRRAVGGRGDGQDAAVAEQPAPRVVRRRARRGGSGCRGCSGCRSAAPAARRRT